MKTNELLEIMKKRRTYRKFSDVGFDINDVIKCIEIASLAPNGANKQPWHFAVVTNQEVKDEIYKEAILVEKDFYENKITDEWKADLDHLLLDYDKPFLKEAPSLIVIFKQNYHINDDGEVEKNYYVNESVGLATGFLISSLHQCGYASLTYTPSPNAFLKKILKRPEGESAFMVLVVGKASDDYELPNITKKNIEEITTRY